MSVSDAPDAIPVAYRNTPTRKHRDLIHHDRDRMNGLTPTFKCVYGHTGYQPDEPIDTFASRAAKIGCAAVPQQMSRHPCLARP